MFTLIPSMVSYAPIPQLRFANAYNALADTLVTTSGTTLAYNFRSPITIGSGDFSHLLISISNWFQNSTAVTIPANGYTIVSMALERVSVASYMPVTFGGSRSIAINPGDNDIHSDLILPSAFGLSKFTRGEQYFLRSKILFSAAGQTFAGTTQPGSPSGLQALVYDSVAGALSPIDGTGTFTTASGTPGQSGFYFPPPFVTLGRFVSGDAPTLIGVGDSIFRGTGDGAGASAGGMWMRSMFDAGLVNNPRAGCLIARAGGTGGTWSAANNGLMRTWLQYAKYGVDQYGTNGLVQSDQPPIWAAMRAAGCVKVLRNYLIPREDTSSDSWATLAGQAPKAAQAPFNPYLTTQLGLGTGVDILIDPVGIYDAGTTNKFAVNGAANYMTADGIHPTAIGHEFGAVAMRTAFASLI